MEWLQIIPWGISALSLLFVILTFTRNGNKDKKTEWEKETSHIDGIKESLIKTNLKLDQVCATTSETRTDIKSLNKEISEMDRRVTILERDVKTAFRTIDEIKEKQDDGRWEA